MPVLGGTVGVGISKRGVYIPSGSLDIWKAARANAANQLVEVVIFGDSTTYGACADSPLYSWTQKLRVLSQLAGFADGGRGIVYSDSSDTSTYNGDITTIVSSSNLDPSGAQTGYTVTPAPFALGIAGATVTLQGICTTIRLHTSIIANTTGVFTYAVDGGAPVTVDSTNLTSTFGYADTILAASGLTLGTHTITVTALGYGTMLAPAIYQQPAASGTGGTLATGTYTYKITAVPNTGTGETTATATSSVAVTSGQTVAMGFSDAYPGGATFKVYRALGAGSYQYIGQVVGSGGGTHPTFTDNGSATPGAAPPSTNNAHNTTTPWAEFNVDFVKSAGIVYHKNATSGIGSGTYFGTGNPDFGNYNAETALGLVPGTAGSPATAPFGWASPKQTSFPRFRNPSLAICAVGINDMQGLSIAGGPSSAEWDAAIHQTALTRSALTNFVRMCRQTGCDPLLVIPHFDMANNTHYFAGLFSTTVMEVAEANGVACIDFNEAIRPIGTLAARGGGSVAVHAAQGAYNMEATFLWNNALSEGGYP